jgi:hypothetical protein
MRKILIVWLALAGVASAQQGTWKAFTSKDGRFTVEFPGAPNEAAPQQVQTAVGPLETHLFTLELPNVAFYAIAYVDYPKDKVGDKSIDSMLESAKDGAVAKVQGTLVDEQKKDFNGNKGLELKIEAKDLMLFGRLMFVQNRLYQILVVVPKPKSGEVPADVTHFENSFTLIQS